jgi:hypothetical protein
MAFDMLYCVAFEMLDAHWLAMRASYMEFNVTSLSAYFCPVPGPLECTVLLIQC